MRTSCITINFVISGGEIFGNAIEGSEKRPVRGMF